MHMANCEPQIGRDRGGVRTMCTVPIGRTREAFVDRRSSFIVAEKMCRRHVIVRHIGSHADVASGGTGKPGAHLPERVECAACVIVIPRAGFLRAEDVLFLLARVGQAFLRSVRELVRALTGARFSRGDGLTSVRDGMAGAHRSNRSV